ncbi:hypothetical protein OU789_13300 [Halocynthiibacter sp. C4]|uniref:hypothetical protein n=1 Tax=Halocynthiibacter sp. C4 TaxID=2992758 RepID=UPI00237A64D1|nr:hypothetical protein [Halocynthiibacter sp. C4]MDE0590907.1 hypothetical protein [Halocynthiibacter sp. C4]
MPRIATEVVCRVTVSLLFTCWLYSLAFAETVVIRNDAGGNLIDRVATIERYRKSDTNVEIRKGYCASACTLFLGLPSVCVEKGARFGFHGPSSAYTGISLPPDKFEYWSRRMALYYPPRIADWFLKSARFRLVGFHYISGSEMIRQGISECAPRKGQGV